MPLSIFSFDATVRVKRVFHPAPASRGFASHVFLVYIVFHFKVCIGVRHGVKNSNLRYEGHILLPGTRDHKVFSLCSKTVCWSLAIR